MLFLLMSFTLNAFGLFLLQTLLPKLAGMPLTDVIYVTVDSPAAAKRTCLLVYGVLSIFHFLGTALLFSYLAHPKPLPYLGLRKPSKYIQVLLAIGIMVGCIPFLSYIQELMGHINFSKAVKESQENSEKLQKALLSLPSVPDFLLTLLVMAVLPAIGEELFFRGLLLRFASKATSIIVLPIVFTAAIFAASHTNVYGLLSIFIAGSLLGYIYYLTGSLWCAIAGHFFFNATSIALSYFADRSAAMARVLSDDHVPIWLVIISLGVSGLCLWALVTHQTPLQPGWTADFEEKETSELGQ